MVCLQVACGGSHTIALSDVGDVYVWGWGKDGQLGLGQWTTSKNTPHLLKTLQATQPKVAVNRNL